MGRSRLTSWAGAVECMNRCKIGRTRCRWRSTTIASIHSREKNFRGVIMVAAVFWYLFVTG